MKPNQPTSAQSLRRRQRQEQALELRVAGMTPTRIGERLGITRQHVHRLIKRAVAEMDAADADRVRELRAVQGVRIEERISELMPRAAEGDHAADRSLVRYFDREAKLHGLDLQRETELQEPIIHVIDMRTPRQREMGVTEGVVEIEAAEFEDVPALGAGESPEADPQGSIEGFGDVAGREPDSLEDRH